jgi:hypothetical protein
MREKNYFRFRETVAVTDLIGNRLRGVFFDAFLRASTRLGAWTRKIKALPFSGTTRIRNLTKLTDGLQIHSRVYKNNSTLERVTRMKGLAIFMALWGTAIGVLTWLALGNGRGNSISNGWVLWRLHLQNLVDRRHRRTRNDSYRNLSTELGASGD